MENIIRTNSLSNTPEFENGCENLVRENLFRANSCNLEQAPSEIPKSAPKSNGALTQKSASSEKLPLQQKSKKFFIFI